ncbi:hypothetical protein BVI1335_70168 [Burkholderia vietnamiensis]|nr:hypothetical protein BVI1335_70168 [Burkholderia vietnamiensis]
MSMKMWVAIAVFGCVCGRHIAMTYAGMNERGACLTILNSKRRSGRFLFALEIK